MSGFEGAVTTRAAVKVSRSPNALTFIYFITKQSVYATNDVPQILPKHYALAHDKSSRPNNEVIKSLK